MNLRRGGGKPSVAGPSNSLSGVQHGYPSWNSAANGTNSGIDQLSHGLTSNQDGGDWEVFTKKTKNRGNAQQWSPPLQNGWQWGDGAGGPYDSVLEAGAQQHQSDVEDYYLLGEDYDDLMSDEFNSACSVNFFEDLDELTDDDQITEPSRQWHCPAYRNGRVKIPAFGKWAGLRENVSDKDIVWPPMVVVMNTQLEMDENYEKWIGMGNQELLYYFSAYTKAVKARHSYGPKGHRGMSILIFESSPVGYLEADHLDKHFTEQSTGRYAWDHHRSLYKNGQRQLYGYMARKEDLDNFNKHFHGKTKLKFEVRSYQEMVVVLMRQMSEDNQQLVWLKNKVVREQRHSKALEESLSTVTQKLLEIQEENHIVRQRTKVQHEQNKEEMDYLEQFFKDQISIINQTLEEKEKAFEEKLQVERTKVRLSTVGLTTAEDDKLRKVEVGEFIDKYKPRESKSLKRNERVVQESRNEKAELIKKNPFILFTSTAFG